MRDNLYTWIITYNAHNSMNPDDSYKGHAKQIQFQAPNAADAIAMANIKIPQAIQPNFDIFEIVDISINGN